MAYISGYVRAAFADATEPIILPSAVKRVNVLLMSLEPAIHVTALLKQSAIPARDSRFPETPAGSRAFTLSRWRAANPHISTTSEGSKAGFGSNGT